MAQKATQAYLHEFTLPPSPEGAKGWAQMDASPCIGLCYRKGILSLGNLTLLMGSKHAYPLL